MPTSGLEPQWATWPANVSQWEHRCDPTGRRAWVPSPETETFPLPTFDETIPPVVPNVQRPQARGDRRESRRRRPAEDDPFKRKSTNITIGLLSFIRKRVFGKKDPSHDRRRADNWPSLNEGRHVVTPAEWRAYGYWARPRVGPVLVHNATPPPSPRNLSHEEIEEIMQSLLDERGEWHTENWVPRVEHPALPPRPAIWHTPRPSALHLPSTALQLNPYLQHRLLGRPPVLFDMRNEPVGVELGELPPAIPGGEPMHILFCPNGPDGAQPATYPPVSELYIGALADDNCDPFPWPMLVLPHHSELPVMVMDVLSALIANFEELMTPEEVAALSEQRRQHMYRAYWERARMMVSGRIPGDDDGLRRIDYLGDRPFFRGLEPAPDGNGFILFVGPSH
ncbi:uncharacterized protein C8Q71DRAFT_724002 [Rhodofomes roseus]|uniref:DUF6699 domain-containing protein n=1 Tax=Rhodofomes roseus TaxID=34475 RepID=A0ABQ8KF74_9APHY|nr:uncharacterized protein C8Q71DRAFT_724002 [Rhodofomes roseus]KAH9836153.1 hypothetical protein C8Q71DRAFT_724002 [Rhodofomes roseus]